MNQSIPNASAALKSSNAAAWTALSEATHEKAMAVASTPWGRMAGKVVAPIISQGISEGWDYASLEKTLAQAFATLPPPPAQEGDAQ